MQQTYPGNNETSLSLVHLELYNKGSARKDTNPGGIKSIFWYQRYEESKLSFMYDMVWYGKKKTCVSIKPIIQIFNCRAYQTINI